MVDRVIGVLAERLEEKFGERFAVYTESVKMGAEKPCFFVECEKAEKVALLGGRYMLRLSVAVKLEGEGDTARFDEQSVTGDLFEIMNLLEVDGKLFHARGLNGSFEGKALVMRCVYDVPVKIVPDEGEEEAAMMEEVTFK
ncbi:MAG: hypothetical protein LUG52_06650 [Clostridia bacterium]|nr:hypothetical protein [Clostridia bacterium]